MKYFIALSVLVFSMADARAQSEPLDAKEVAELESSVAESPNDFAARKKLLNHYFQTRFKSVDARAAREKHVLWVIANRPAAKIAGQPQCDLNSILEPGAYNDGKKLWQEQSEAHSKNPRILGNAANFFLIHDRPLAEDLFKQAQQLEPTNPQWPDRLGHLFALDRGKNAAANSLAEYEKAQAADASEESRFVRLAELAKSAFAAGEIEKASRYANELIAESQTFTKDWNYGNAIHHGNNVLGRVALQQGDLKQANEYLLKAGRTPGSPQLNSFGPNMSLAKELLRAGERDTVLEYFELCRVFWRLGGDRLDHWAKDVKAGNVPEFGANLVY